MTPVEKTDHALNSRIERLQANLREASSEAGRQAFTRSLVTCVGLGEALVKYVRQVDEFAQTRQQELKAEQAVLIAQHEDLMKSGIALLERLKASPADAAVRKEIAAAQQAMAGIQKTLRRGANTLQRDTSPAIAMIDRLALSMRRFAEADQIDALKRALRMVLDDTRELYRSQPTLPAKNLLDVDAWEKAAVASIDQAADFHEAFAHAGYQALLALEVMALALSATPPRTTEEALDAGGVAVVTRLKDIMTRLTSG